MRSSRNPYIIMISTGPEIGHVRPGRTIAWSVDRIRNIRTDVAAGALVNHKRSLGRLGLLFLGLGGRRCTPYGRRMFAYLESMRTGFLCGQLEPALRHS